MPIIIATAGASNANSYVTLAEAETYFTTRLHITAWEDAGSTEKESALIWAARLIGYTVRFNGSKASSTQSMQWPRSDLTVNGEEVDDATVPQLIKDIQCDLAFLLLSTDRTLENDAAAQGLTSVKAGSVALTFKDTIKPPTAVPDTLLAMLPIEWVWRAVPYPLVVS